MSHQVLIIMILDISILTDRVPILDKSMHYFLSILACHWSQGL